MFQFSGLTFALSPACNRLISSNLPTHLPLIRHHLQLKPLDFHQILDRSLFSPWQLGHMLGETNLPSENVCISDFFKIILANLLASSTTSPEKLSSINITSQDGTSCVVFLLLQVKLNQCAKLSCKALINLSAGTSLADTQR